MTGNIHAMAQTEDKIMAFATSDVFEKLFTEGMDLVEETAHYLDGEGRSESKLLERASALSYASESMRLTTRLMQAASWLLVQRAIKEGEMEASDARDPKYRIGAKAICIAKGEPSSELPARLKELLIQSEAIYTRIDRLDGAMYGENSETVANPVNEQHDRLQSLFGSFGE